MTGIISPNPFISPFNKPFQNSFGFESPDSGGAGNDLINENFNTASNPPTGWSASGNSNVVSQEMLNVVVSGSDAFMEPPLWTPSNTVWVGVDFFMDSGFVINSGQQFIIIALLPSSPKLTLNIFSDGGTFKWRTRIRSDTGSLISVTHDTPVFELNTNYRITIDEERATTNVSSDGGGRIWIDSVLMRDSLDIDNFDLGPVDEIRLGISSTGASVTGTTRNDNLLVGTFGSPP